MLSKFHFNSVISIRLWRSPPMIMVALVSCIPVLDKFVYTESPVPVGASWKVKVCIPNAGWQFLGIIAQNDVSLAYNSSYSDSSSYVWAGANQVYSGGSNTPALRSGFNSICTSTYYFQLLETELLMLQETPDGTNTLFRLTIPGKGSYVIHLNMHASQTVLDLDQVTSAVFD